MAGWRGVARCAVGAVGTPAHTRPTTAALCTPYLRVEGCDDELRGLALPVGLPRNHGRHSGAAIVGRGVAGWSGARQRVGQGRKAALCLGKRRHRLQSRRYHTAIPTGTAGPARRRSRQTGRRARDRTPGGTDGHRRGARRRRAAVGDSGILTAPPLLPAPLPGSLCRQATSLTHSSTRPSTWMAKISASATSVFCPPLSCFIDIVSLPPNDTCGRVEGGRGWSAGGERRWWREAPEGWAAAHKSCCGARHKGHIPSCRHPP